jgi:tripartite-type tricarboxylate transporter receptor subunit TctC
MSSGREGTVKFRRRQFLRLTAGAAVLSVMPRIAKAQPYPLRQITLVVPYAPGGSTDVIARNVAERMKASLSQPVIVENVTGAGGSIGVGRVARASPDGYTLSLGQTGSHVLNGATYALQYDLLKDFEPIALLASNPHLILAKKSVPADDLQGFIAWLKANPGKAAKGTSGTGSGSHIAGLLFQKETSTRFGFVPYRGGSQVMQDLLGGQIDMAITDVTTAMTQVRAGSVKALAVTASTRLSSAPEIPTVEEAGLPGFNISLWFGLWAPRGTPQPIIARLNAAAVESLANAGLRARLADLGLEIFPRDQQTPEALRAL